MAKEEREPEQEEPPVDRAATDNLIGFFALLLEIDMRNNPHLYQLPHDEEHD